MDSSDEEGSKNSEEESFSPTIHSQNFSVKGEEDRPGRVLLRPWLENMLESGVIDGLEWMDKEKTMFKVPWKHRSKKDWSTRHSSVFLEWAKNTGRWNRGDPTPNYAQLKTRLRCAFNKAPDIEEMKVFHLSQGEEPYKVYKFRSKRDHTSGKSSSSSKSFSKNKFISSWTSGVKIKFEKCEEEYVMDDQESSYAELPTTNDRSSAKGGQVNGADVNGNAAAADSAYGTGKSLYLKNKLLQTDLNRQSSHHDLKAEVEDVEMTNLSNIIPLTVEQFSSFASDDSDSDRDGSRNGTPARSKHQRNRQKTIRSLDKDQQSRSLLATSVSSAGVEPQSHSRVGEVGDCSSSNLHFLRVATLFVEAEEQRKQQEMNSNSNNNKELKKEANNEAERPLLVKQEVVEKQDVEDSSAGRKIAEVSSFKESEKSFKEEASVTMSGSVESSSAPQVVRFSALSSKSPSSLIRTAVHPSLPKLTPLTSIKKTAAAALDGQGAKKIRDMFMAPSTSHSVVLSQQLLNFQLKAKLMQLQQFKRMQNIPVIIPQVVSAAAAAVRPRVESSGVPAVLLSTCLSSAASNHVGVPLPSHIRQLQFTPHLASQVNHVTPQMITIPKSFGQNAVLAALYEKTQQQLMTKSSIGLSATSLAVLSEASKFLSSTAQPGSVLTSPAYSAEERDPITTTTAVSAAQSQLDAAMNSDVTTTTYDVDAEPDSARSSGDLEMVDSQQEALDLSSSSMLEKHPVEVKAQKDLPEAVDSDTQPRDRANVGDAVHSQASPNEEVMSIANLTDKLSELKIKISKLEEAHAVPDLSKSLAELVGDFEDLLKVFSLRETKLKSQEDVLYWRTKFLDSEIKNLDLMTKVFTKGPVENPQAQATVMPQRLNSGSQQSDFGPQVGGVQSLRPHDLSTKEAPTSPLLPSIAKKYNFPMSFHIINNNALTKGQEQNNMLGQMCNKVPVSIPLPPVVSSVVPFSASMTNGQVPATAAISSASPLNYSLGTGTARSPKPFKVQVNVSRLSEAPGTGVVYPIPQEPQRRLQSPQASLSQIITNGFNTGQTPPMRSKTFQQSGHEMGAVSLASPPSLSPSMINIQNPLANQKRIVMISTSHCNVQSQEPFVKIHDDPAPAEKAAAIDRASSVGTERTSPESGQDMRLAAGEHNLARCRSRSPSGGDGLSAKKMRLDGGSVEEVVQPVASKGNEDQFNSFKDWLKETQVRH